PFKYAPPVAVLLAPLALLPRTVGVVLWNTGSVLLLLVSLRRLTRIDGAPDDADGSWAALALAGPIGTVLFYGQVDLWLLGLLVLGAAAARARDDGGIALGFSILTTAGGARRALLPRPPALEGARHGRRRRAPRLCDLRAARRRRDARPRGL